jgi:hypothetical protein
MSKKLNPSDADKQDQQPSALKSYVTKTLNDMKTDLAATGTAMARQGASELALALKSFPAIGPVDAVGTPYNPTQMQVSQEFGVYGRNAAEPESTTDVQAQLQRESKPVPSKEPEMDLEP